MSRVFSSCLPIVAMLTACSEKPFEEIQPTMVKHINSETSINNEIITTANPGLTQQDASDPCRTLNLNGAQITIDSW